MGGRAAPSQPSPRAGDSRPWSITPIRTTTTQDPPGTSLLAFALDGKRVVYLSERDEHDVWEVYSSWIDVQPAVHAPPLGSRSVLR